MDHIFAYLLTIIKMLLMDLPCLLCLLACLFYCSAHHQPYAERIQGEHLPPRQENLHHGQGQVCQGASSDQG